jgi:tetratricopeptide (TPR) repeat protein
LRTPGAGELRQAEEAFMQVENLDRADGPLNLARVFLREGRIDEAVVRLEQAAGHQPSAYPWVVAWLTGQVNRQNGFLDEAIENFRNILDTRYQLARDRGFDFSLDYRVSNMLAQTLLERAQLERGDGRSEIRNAFITDAISWYGHTLSIEPENSEAHYGLSQAYAQADETGLSERHRRLYQTYKVNDNARDRAIALARRMDPAADHAANPVAIYDLQREPGTGGLAADKASE